MKQRLLFIIFVLVGSATITNAQHPDALLWKISGNGIEQPSYVYGTMHMICPDDFFLTDQVQQALDQTQQLVLELDMDDPSFMTQMQQLSVNPGMRNIGDELSAEEKQAINDFFTKHYQADLSQLGILKPFTLLSMMMMKGLSCPEPASYEMTFMQHASENKWDLIGLETPADQIAIFDAIPVREQLDWLMNYLSGSRSLTEDVDKMVSIYKSEDIDGLLDLMVEYPEYEAMQDELLFERNQRWIEPMKNHLSQKPTFFAVGAAHLSSDKGVITLLRNEGYTVEPVLSN